MITKNCNSLNMIQIAFALGDENGKLINKNSVWQFNFHFDLDKSKKNEQAISLLKTSGINFKKLLTDGIPHEKFSEQFMASGLICNPNFRWIVFHGSSDFGYFMKLLSGKNLPKTLPDFQTQLEVFFPKIYDVKYITEKIPGFNGSLRRFGEMLQVIFHITFLIILRSKDSEMHIKQEAILFLHWMYSQL